MSTFVYTKLTKLFNQHLCCAPRVTKSGNIQPNLRLIPKLFFFLQYLHIFLTSSCQVPKIHSK